MADEAGGFGQGPMGPATADEAEDIFPGGARGAAPRVGAGIPGRGGAGVVAARPPAGAAPRVGVDEFAVGEVVGEPSFPVVGREVGEEAVDLHTEVGADGGEAAEEFAEASPAQMAAAESGEESAMSDLLGIEGFEPPRPAGEGALDGQPFREAGEGAETEQQEFLPILAALVPTLVSAVGPAVARGIGGLLSSRAKRVIKHIPRPPTPVGAAAKTALSAVAGGPGRSNLLGLIAKLLETAEESAGESGMEVDEALVQQAAAALEVIVDIDDRVRITQTTQIPWRRISALRIQFPSGATYRGTGFLIGPRAVATAGHCVYLHNQGGWARKVTVIPGCNGASTPYGQAESSSLRSVSGWVTSRKPESDYGCVMLPAGTFGGHNLGSFGFAAFDSAALLAQAAVLSGYPGDKPFAELWGASRFIKTVTAKTLIYNTASMGGQSGAPVYIKRNGQRYVVGIHNYGATTGNSATRVTKPVYDRLRAWSQA